MLQSTITNLDIIVSQEKEILEISLVNVLIFESFQITKSS